VYVARWSRNLRQGDIFGLTLYPKLKSQPRIARTHGWQVDAEQAIALEYLADEQYAVVISHCCEFSEGKRERFLIARTQKFPPRMEPEMRATIEASNAAVRVDEDQPERREWLEFFVLDPVVGCFDDDKRLVDFTTIMSVHKTMISHIKDMKKAELEQPHREQFRKKLGLFLARDADDVKEDRRIEPWWKPEADESKEQATVEGDE
jgi:hypothetical protein